MAHSTQKIVNKAIQSELLKLPSKKQEEKYRTIIKEFRKGATVEQVYELLQEKFGVKRVTAISLVKTALGWVRRSTAEAIGGYVMENARCMQQIRLEEVYNKCMESRNYKEAINALRELNKIFGLYKDMNVNNTVINTTGNPQTIAFKFGTDDNAMYIAPNTIEDNTVQTDFVYNNNEGTNTDNNE